jgi:hypothetical protein
MCPALEVGEWYFSPSPYSIVTSPIFLAPLFYGHENGTPQLIQEHGLYAVQIYLQEKMSWILWYYRGSNPLSGLGPSSALHERSFVLFYNGHSYSKSNDELELNIDFFPYPKPHYLFRIKMPLL